MTSTSQSRRVSKLVFYNAIMFTVLPLGAYIVFKPSKSDLAEESRKIAAMREVRVNKEKTKEIVKLILDSSKDEKKDAEIDKLLKRGV